MASRKYFILPIVACLCSVGPVVGGVSAKNIVASRTSIPMQIDGLLAEASWNGAVPVTSFQQFDPEEGAAPTEATSVRVLYDDDAVYIGIICSDSNPPLIVRQLTRRDRTAQADRVTVMIDSFHDRSTAFLFAGTVSGVQSDGVLSQDGLVYDVQWDAVWEFEAQIVPGGWTAEFRIPYGVLRFSGQDSEYVWGINFRRYIARKKETDEWVMVPRSNSPPGTISSVSQMGNLSGIINIHPPLHVEATSYLLSKAKYIQQPAPFSRKDDYSATGGLDLKYGLTDNFTLDAAINPDFGQVEVDQAVLNLTVFETLYPEKRPFFLEGSQIFSFGNAFDNRQLRLFYSRRIGRTPSLPDTATPGYRFVDPPQSTTILGAVKFTGRTENGLTVGALSTLTRKEEGFEEDPTGVRRDPVVLEPRATYNVVRLKQEVFSNSFIGLIGTGALKDNRLPSLAGGLDWNFRLGDGRFGIDGYLARSTAVPLTGERVNGTAGKIGFGQLEDDHVLAFTLYDFSTRTFSIDDLGFYNQPREHGGATVVTYKEEVASDPVRRYSLTLQSDYRWNWNGAGTVRQLEFEPLWELRNFWAFSFDVVHEFQAYDDENRGIIGLYVRPAADRFTATLQTDFRQPIIVSAVCGYRTAGNGLNEFASTWQLTLRPSSWAEFVPAFALVRTRNEEAWPLFFYTPAGRNLFGDRDVDEYDLSLRGTVTFSRNFSFQFFGQILLAKGGYTNFRELGDGSTLTSYPYDRANGDPDFNEKVLNANAVLRWEYLPGSTIYLVWTQARYGINPPFDSGFGENLAEAFRLPMDNVLLAKITYRWSP